VLKLTCYLQPAGLELNDLADTSRPPLLRKNAALTGREHRLPAGNRRGTFA
jgi:hypothetical protein